MAATEGCVVPNATQRQPKVVIAEQAGDITPINAIEAQKLNASTGEERLNRRVMLTVSAASATTTRTVAVDWIQGPRQMTPARHLRPASQAGPQYIQTVPCVLQ